MSYHYISSITQSNAVVQSVIAHFLGPQSLDLIVSKNNCLEINSIKQEGLQHVFNVPIYGRITTIEKYTPISIFPLFCPL